MRWNRGSSSDEAITTAVKQFEGAPWLNRGTRASPLRMSKQNEYYLTKD